MEFDFEERESDLPYIETVWRTHSERAGVFMSTAVSHWEMVVTRHRGRLQLTVRGPETKATPAHGPEDTEFLGIVFTLGTYMPQLPIGKLVNAALTLPEATGKSFWLGGSSWQFPDYENAEAFVARLVRNGLLARDSLVEAALDGQLSDVSLRSVQRRFLRATGLTHSAVRQIERARYASALLQQGASIADVVDQAVYADQPHLTRSLKRLVGQTPAQIVRASQAK